MATSGALPDQRMRTAAREVSGRSRWRLRPVDRAALGIWLGSRIAVLAISLYARYGTPSGRASSWLGLWQHWDWYRYLTIAEYGYTSGQGPAYDQNITAFFPGFPLLLHAVHVVVRNWAVSGLLISLVAGAVASVALARLTAFEWDARTRGADPAGGTRAASTAVLVLVCAPAAVFLAVGYTESAFLAFAVPGWLAARRHQWIRAGALVALAGTVRINGLFLALAVAVLFLLARPGRGDWSRSPALLLPFEVVGGYLAYLKHVTGDWLAWLHAEQSGWNRRLTNPITTLRTSWHDAFGSFGGARVADRAAAGARTSELLGLPSGERLAGIGPMDQWAFRLELVAAAVGVALLVALAWRRRWAELVYVGLSVVGLVTSGYYTSIPREMLLWFPLWTGLGLCLARRRWATAVYVAAGGACMVCVALLFFSGQWAG